MRAIKFRLWDSVFNKFVFYEGIFNNLSDYLVGENGGQYIGLKDKKGKEIYEGDIVKSEGLHIDKMLVEYDETNISFGLIDREEKEYEILGNIYENPELLHVP